jgi:hypothetical protein
VRLLEPVAPARLAAALSAGLMTGFVAGLPTGRRLVTGFHRLLLALGRRRTTLHRPIPIATITVATIPIATAVSITAVSVSMAEAALVAPEGAIVAVGVVAPARVARLMLRLLRGGLMLRREALVEHVLAFIVAELVAAIAGQALTAAVDHISRLLQLLAVSHNDAHVVLGVLQIILCQHRIAGRLSIARESEILLGDMRWRAADFHIRSVGFEAARQRVVAFPVVVVPAAPAAILLSLPHCPNGSYVT